MNEAEHPCYDCAHGDLTEDREPCKTCCSGKPQWISVEHNLLRLFFAAYLRAIDRRGCYDLHDGHNEGCKSVQDCCDVCDCGRKELDELIAQLKEVAPDA